jgi:hypothetical protein
MLLLLLQARRPAKAVVREVQAPTKQVQLELAVLVLLLFPCACIGGDDDEDMIK